MINIRLSPMARADLDGIWNYSVQVWNLDQAEAYMRVIEASFNILAGQPELGRRINDIRKGYFSFPSGSHLPIYKITNGYIDIIRILHKSSDVVRHI